MEKIVILVSYRATQGLLVYR